MQDICEDDRGRLVRLESDEMMSVLALSRAINRRNWIRIKQEGWDAIASSPPGTPVIVGYMVDGELLSVARAAGRIGPFMIDNYEAVTVPASEWLKENPRPTDD